MAGGPVAWAVAGGHRLMDAPGMTIVPGFTDRTIETRPETAPNGYPAEMARIHVMPLDIEIEAAADATVMAAAQALGYYWPTTCGGEARCTTCACEVVSGMAALTPMGRAEERALVTERGPGVLRTSVRLACQARVRDAAATITLKMPACGRRSMLVVGREAGDLRPGARNRFHGFAGSDNDVHHHRTLHRHEGRLLRRRLPRRLHLHARGRPAVLHRPDTCIDCAACEVVCPVTAIFFEEDVPADWKATSQINRQFFKDVPAGERTFRPRTERA